MPKILLQAELDVYQTTTFKQGTRYVTLKRNLPIGTEVENFGIDSEREIPVETELGQKLVCFQAGMFFVYIDGERVSADGYIPKDQLMAAFPDFVWSGD